MIVQRRAFQFRLFDPQFSRLLAVIVLAASEQRPAADHLGAEILHPAGLIDIREIALGEAALGHDVGESLGRVVGVVVGNSRRDPRIERGDCFLDLRLRDAVALRGRLQARIPIERQVDGLLQGEGVLG